MLKRFLAFSTIGLASANAFGGQSTGGRSNTVTVQAGQGSPITISVPAAPQEIETPYALTGQDATNRNLQWHTMQYVQGGLIWIVE